MATTPPATSTLAPAPITTPMVGSNGMVTPTWAMFFQKVNLRIGGTFSNTLTQVISEIATMDGEISDLQAADTTLTAIVATQGTEIAANTTELATHDGEITTLQATKAPLASPTFTGTVTAGNVLLPSTGGIALTVGTAGTPATTSATILLNNGLGSTGIELVSSAGGGAFIQGGPQQLNFFTFTGAVGSEGYTQRATITSSGMAVTGTFTATTKNFTIPYPGDPTRLLVHSVTEGPEISVFYRGTGQLVNGIATITLPDYFEALTLTSGRTVLLAPQFASATDPISLLAASVVVNGQFTVRAYDANNPAQTFCWEVKAIRSDQPALEVVVPAPPKEIPEL